MRLVDGLEKKAFEAPGFSLEKAGVGWQCFYGFRFPFLVYGCDIDWIRQELLGSFFGFRFPLLI